MHSIMEVLGIILLTYLIIKYIETLITSERYDYESHEVNIDNIDTNDKPVNLKLDCQDTSGDGK